MQRWIRKAKAHLELNQERDMKDFYRNIRNKRKSRQDVGPFLKGVMSLVKKCAEKTELLNASNASFFTGKPALSNLRPL